MCTLEPMGYASNQFFTIPYLVLNKALSNELAGPSAATSQIVELVQQTCSNMLATNAGFKQQTVEALVAFCENPANRTADVVADIPILTAQAWCWNSLPEEQK